MLTPFRRTAATAAALVAGALALAATASASPVRERGDDGRDVTTIAVFGDLPYSQAQIDHVDNLSTSVDADPDVSLALHLGDIKSGSTQCTDARFQLVRNAFDRFDDPLVYTPGDNEWTDCHRTNNGSFLPTERLAKLRTLFFPQPGRTLGAHPARVETQAAERRFRTYVENVRWEQGDVVFATLDVPGSNNDLVPWGAPWNTDPFKAEQAAEVAGRTRAVVAWIRQAFEEAREEHARGVVLALQADMWDQTITTADITGFVPIVQEIATQSRRFRRPVLLLNGDSHTYEVDHPLADPGTAFNTVYGVTAPVPNLTRLTVQGSTVTPSGWVRLTIDPETAGLWSFQRVDVAF